MSNPATLAGMGINRTGWRLTERVDGDELLDSGQISRTETRRSLADLRRLNGLLFGVQATLAPLRPRLRAAPKPVTVLDLGTGSGQLAQALHRWARDDHQALQILAFDLAPSHLRAAREWNTRLDLPHIHLAAADALHLPLADSAVDYVTSSLLLHHFSPEALVTLLAECGRVARRGVVMSDLWRHPLPYYLYKGLAEPLLVRSPVTRVDSTISFRRAYRPEEFRRLAARALPHATVRLAFPSFRMILVADR